MNKAIKDSCEKTQDAEKSRIEVRPALNTANKDVKANKYQVHVKKFDHGTAEDVLLWYNKVREAETM